MAFFFTLSFCLAEKVYAVVDQHQTEVMSLQMLNSKDCDVFALDFFSSNSLGSLSPLAGHS
jgi:hypothetical protein